MAEGPKLRVLRVYHGGRDPAHRERDRALNACGVDVTLVVPATWPESGGESRLSVEEYPVVELPVERSGDVNRHRYSDSARLAALIREVNPHVLDIHEEPFSAVARQWLTVAPDRLPVVMYTAQNVDKRFPPPFAQYENAAYRRIAGLYPCSGQAAAVARGKGFAGTIRVLPLGYDATFFFPGQQSVDDAEVMLGLFGRLLPEKGVLDAVRILARLNAVRPTRLIVNGEGPEGGPARELAATLGIADRLELAPWLPAADVAAIYRRSHVVLVPSRPTETWVEQFGRVIVEAQASGAVVAGYSTGTIPEVAGDAAVLVDVAAPLQLADRIGALLADADEFTRLRDRGLALGSARTWQRVGHGQAELYRRVVSGERRLDLPRSPRLRRAAARREFGATASTTAGTRPFALPVLRRGGAVSAALAATIDAAAELAACVPVRQTAERS
jgi:glycosyltransferase involved in cell wall biosynthesis